MPLRHQHPSIELFDRELILIVRENFALNIPVSKHIES